MVANYTDLVAQRAAANALTDVVNNIGEAQAAPTQYTLLDRLKAVAEPADVVEITMTLDTSAYTAADLLADVQAFTGVRAAGGRSVLQSITIIDEDAQGVALSVIFSKTSTSFGTENSAPNISDANASAGILGFVPIATTDYIDVRNIGLVLESGADTNVYVGILNGAGTPTFTAAGLKLKLGILFN